MNIYSHRITTRITIHKENTSAFSNVEWASKKIKISPSKEDLLEKINFKKNK